MLIGEYDYDTDIAVQRQESLMIGIRQGIERGKSLGLAEGKSLGLAEGKSLGLAEGEVRGSRQKALETARILKQFGDSVQKIVQVTGLTVQEVETLK